MAKNTNNPPPSRRRRYISLVLFIEREEIKWGLNGVACPTYNASLKKKIDNLN